MTLLSGANFTIATLDKADLTGGAHLEDADFSGANLRGTDLTGANLQGADFGGAQMHGALFRFAHLEGANLNDTDIEAADFSATHLEGAKLAGAKVKAVDFRGATIWLTAPPDGAMPLADVSELRIRPLDEADLPALLAAIERVPSPRGKARLKSVLAPIMAIAESRSWSSSPDAQKWQAIVARSQTTLSDSYGRDLTEALGQLMCKPRWSGGSVATGIAKRALGGHFRGNPMAIYDRARAEDCPAAKNVPKTVMQDFATAIDAARAN